MSNPYERLWKDKMDIYRYDKSKVNNVTKSTEQKIDSGVKCHYSGGSLADTGEDGIPTINNSHKLFCGLDAVKEGDKVIVTQYRSGTIVTLTVGEGFPYSGGMQFAVKRGGTA